LRQRPLRRWLDLPPTGGQLQGMLTRKSRSPRHQPLPPGPRRAASPAESAPHGVCAPRGHVSDLKTQGSSANKNKMRGITREDYGIEKIILDQKTYRGGGEDELIKGTARPYHPALQGATCHDLLVVLGVGFEPGSRRPRSAREVKSPSLAACCAVTPAFLAPNKSPNKSCVFSKLSKPSSATPLQTLTIISPSHPGARTANPAGTARASTTRAFPTPRSATVPGIPRTPRSRRPVRLAITAVP
jgi:hypothetical protein